MDENTVKTDMAEASAVLPTETAESDKNPTPVSLPEETAGTHPQQPLPETPRRDRLQEERAIAAERQRQQRTAEQSAGSMYTGEGQSAPASVAFARAFAEALQ